MWKQYQAIALFGIAVLALSWTALTFIVAPRIAHQKTMEMLTRAGFETSRIPKPRFGFGALLYEDIAFDADGFSTAKYIKVTYNPFLLCFRGRFTNLDIIDLTLTGDWSGEEYSSLSFAGWRPPAAVTALPVQSFENISIENLRLTFLSQSAGGISFFFDIQTNRKAGKVEFQSNIRSEQKYMSLIAKSTGLIDGPRWFSDVEIVEAKLEHPSGKLKASRMNGWIHFSQDGKNDSGIKGKLQAGGLTLFSLPWQNASATLDYQNGNFRLFTGAKSVGYDGIGLDLNMLRNTDSFPVIGGSVTAPEMSVLLDYLRSHEGYEGVIADLEPHKDIKDLHIDYLVQQEKDGTVLRYSLKKDNRPLGADGRILLAE